MQARLALARENDPYRHVERIRPSSQVWPLLSTWQYVHFIGQFSFFIAFFVPTRQHLCIDIVSVYVIPAMFCQQDGGVTYGKAKDTNERL